MAKKSVKKKTASPKEKKKVNKSKKVSSAKKAIKQTKIRYPISKKEIPAKINLALRKLILFAALFIISYILYSISSNKLLSNLFWMIALITGFIALAFFIAWLIFIMMKVERR